MRDYSNNKESLIDLLLSIIKKYNLSCSYLNINVPNDLKLNYPKVYYSKYNKENYEILKKDYNIDKDISKLYILLIYGFNHMIRFNKNGKFNLPVGNIDFNKNVYNAINNYLDFNRKNDIIFYSKDYEDFINNFNFKKDDFIYFDPPYLISNSEYNKFWNIFNEEKLYKILDKLNEMGIYFGLSNVIEHKGKTNEILKNGCQNIMSIK